MRIGALLRGGLCVRAHWFGWVRFSSMQFGSMQFSSMRFGSARPRVQQLSVSLPGGSALIWAVVGVARAPVTAYAVIAESV